MTLKPRHLAGVFYWDGSFIKIPSSGIAPNGIFRLRFPVILCRIARLHTAAIPLPGA